MPCLARPALALLFCAVIPLLAVDPAAGQGRALGQAQPGSNGRKARPQQEPPTPGALNGQAAVDALGGELGNRVVERGGSLEQYAALLSADESAWITDEGQLMFVDVIDHHLDADGNPVPEEPTASTGPPPTPAFLLPNGLPIHHSKPGAPWTIYVDFDGETVFSVVWRISGRRTTGLTIDADASTFNAEEQAVISRTWGRVAEDWAPFDVNVTTERPAVIGPTVLWSIVGRNPGDLGFPSGVGGVSLFTLDYVPFGAQTPTFTFWGPWGATNHSTIADVISQEDGHMFGLLHDGLIRTDGGILEYYGGHGTGATSWGPIMGAPEDRHVTQWSRGEYPGAINPLFGGPFAVQDDIAIIAGKLGFRADDFAGDIGGAGPLAQPTTGVIGATTDVDVFALPLANEVHIDITPFRAGEQTDGGNLDVAAEILNAAGVVVASADVVDETAATLIADLPSGPHYLRVRPSANPANYTTYGSLGAYTVTGTFVRVVKLTAFDEPVTTSQFTPGRTVPVKFALTDSVAAARVQLWSSPTATPGDVLAETSCKAQTQGRQHCNLKLPATLVSGATYWIVAQFQDLDGHWVTPGAANGAATPNPVPIVVE